MLAKPVPRPEWAPLPRPGCHGVQFKVLLHQPTLVLAGDDDPIVPLINARILTRLIPDARLHIVTGGGHLFLLEQPDTIAGLITDFLRNP